MGLQISLKTQHYISLPKLLWTNQTIHSGNIKNFKKVFKSHDDPYLSLLALQTSPAPSNNTLPLTLLKKRPVSTILPSMNTIIAINSKKICTI